ncbi:MAG: hypothetical protein C4586_03740 [Anaerolineaceae bacterium]|nr:MAG: hypothetical protein C4586_03740 [Anaerolineaceae bacterium]
MTTNKQRLAQLESVKRDAVEMDNRLFTQEVRTESHKYFIDGVQVDEAKYKKELAAYLRIRKNDRVPAEIVYNLKDGVQ